MSHIVAIVALAVFLLAILPLHPVRIVIASTVLLCFILFTVADDTKPSAPTARISYRGSI